MNKKAMFMYNFKFIFWGFIVGFLLGAVLMYLIWKDMLPFKIPL